MREKNEILIWGILIGLALIWGSSFILMDRCLEAFEPLHVGALRMVIAAICLIPFSLHRIKDVPSGSWKIFPLVGWIGSGIPAFLFPYALKGINSATEGILNGLTPIFTLIFGIFFGASITRKKGIGIMMGLLGAILVTLGGNQGLEGKWTYGLLIVLATMMYGLSVNITKKYLNDTDPIAISAFSFGIVAIPYAVYIYFSDIPSILIHHPSGWSSLGFAIILGLLNTAISTIIFFQLIQMTDAIRAASVTYMMPIVAVMWGIFRTNKEDIVLIQILGMLIILTSVYLVNKKDTQPIP